MGIKTVVDGLEMFCFARGPGAAKCDGCGKVLPSTREDLFEDLKRERWTVGGEHIGAPSYCPDCPAETP